MKQTLLFLLFLVVPLCLHAAEVKNLAVTQQGNKVVVRYDLVGKLGEKEADISASVEVDGGRYGAEKLSLTGDVGRKVKVGKGRSFTWDGLKDFPAGFDGDVTWDVEASGGTVAAPAPVAASGSGGFTDPTVGMELVPVKGGCFQMGDTFGDGQSDEKPVHEVCVSDFAMGKFEVTVGQFRRFINATGYRTDAENNSGGKNGCWAQEFVAEKEWDYREWASWRKPNKYQENEENHPVSCVSWNDAQEFIKWLNGKSGANYRLPTEAEWEYAARAGSGERNYWGNSKDAACGYANVADQTKFGGGISWYNKHECSDGYPYVAPVGSFKPNGLGLYDMMGNVWQWTGDWYDKEYYGSSPRSNPHGPSSSSSRVLRGGSWDSDPPRVRAAIRYGDGPANRRSYLGFRLVAPVK